MPISYQKCVSASSCDMLVAISTNFCDIINVLVKSSMCESKCTSCHVRNVLLEMCEQL